MSISTSISRSATRSAWRERCRESHLTRRDREYADFLSSRFLTHGARFCWNSQKVVQQQWGHVNGRRVTSRCIEKRNESLVDAGLLERVIHSAPGQPAVYRAVIPGHPGYRPLTIRRRGISPKRLLASFRKETETMPRGTGVYVPRRDRVSHPEQYRRPASEPGLPVMEARHAGNCARCAVSYGPGDRITRYAEGWGHVDCEMFVGGV